MPEQEKEKNMQEASKKEELETKEEFEIKKLMEKISKTNRNVTMPFTAPPLLS